MAGKSQPRTRARADVALRVPGLGSAALSVAAHKLVLSQCSEEYLMFTKIALRFICPVQAPWDAALIPGKGRVSQA